MKRGTARQLAVGLVVAVMGSMVWVGAAEAVPPFSTPPKDKFRLSPLVQSLLQCRADLGTCTTALTECEAQAPAAVLQTGQTTVYAAGDDGDIRAGVGVEWPNPRFKNNGDGTVTDNLTGLIWIRDWDCSVLSGWLRVNWATALMNANNLADGDCGLTDGSVAGDWRLPNRKELESVLNLQFSGPALSDTAGTGQWTNGNPFTGVPRSGLGQQFTYWSSTTVAGGTAKYAWVVNFSNGDVDGTGKFRERQVLAVSGGGL